MLWVHQLHHNTPWIHPNGMHQPGSMHANEDIAIADQLGLLRDGHGAIEGQRAKDQRLSIQTDTSRRLLQGIESLLTQLSVRTPSRPADVANTAAIRRLLGHQPDAGIKSRLEVSPKVGRMNALHRQIPRKVPEEAVLWRLDPILKATVLRSQRSQHLPGVWAAVGFHAGLPQWRHIVGHCDVLGKLSLQLQHSGCHPCLKYRSHAVPDIRCEAVFALDHHECRVGLQGASRPTWRPRGQLGGDLAHRTGGSRAVDAPTYVLLVTRPLLPEACDPRPGPVVVAQRAGIILEGQRAEIGLQICLDGCQV
mmetsp:Transcript_33034/g.77076  ORF Transcript_33034/g.77076 Transcript_33034/m.77076 type:complete len:308 (-) Transcript_33034:126-1049(-)